MTSESTASRPLPGELDARLQGRVRSLDGLRGVAVLAVMLFHTASSPLSGGFLGVDVFFTLSGFLIAGILVRQWDQNGMIVLPVFWLRRARRLAPALLLLLTALATARLAIPQLDSSAWRIDILAALTYTTNWFQIVSGGDYFAQFGMRSPLMHTWSLAIEEQFYVLFAILIFVLVARLSRTRLVVVLCALAITSAIWMAWLGSHNPTWAYYGTWSRVQALLIGAALGILVQSRASIPARLRVEGRFLSFVGWTGAIGLLMIFVLPLDLAFMFRGGFALVALLTSATILGLLNTGAMDRLFSWRPLVALGVVSYGVYLWHWPVFEWLQSRDGATRGDEAWSFVVTIAFASASFILVEKPIREGRFSNWPVRRQWLAYGLGSLAICLMVFLPARTHAIDPGLSWPPADEVPSRVFVGGDSTMLTLTKYFPAERYPDTVVSGYTPIGCGLMPGDFLQQGNAVKRDDCEQWPSEWADALTSQPPQVSVVGSLVWDLFDRSTPAGARGPGTPQFDAAFGDAFRRAAEQASKSGSVPTYVLSIPCMSARIDQEILNDPLRVERANTLIRQAIDGLPNVTFTDLSSLTCREDGTAIVTRNGRVLRDDGVHWTSQGAEEVWSLLLNLMASDGVTRTAAR